ncbi:NADP-dependent oxidoreductase [Actinophytocola sp.]|uniref:NADP-dependent oxidoreductase n=1 Tax=Actinophytocola sp. TaxID=1872138 RepID=UPI002ED1C9A4
MRAYGFTAYGGPETEAWLDLPTPEPGLGEILVAVRAAGVNPVDWKVRAGMHRAFRQLTLPAVMGREVAGVVERVGAGVTEFAVGDAVFGSGDGGGYAELCTLPADRSAPKPAEVSFTDAAALPVAAGTAYDALAQLGLSPGDTLLILGVGGGVGVAAAQLARTAGVTVIGTASAAKRTFVESLGVTALSYDTGDLSLPAGVNAILDLAGTIRDVSSLITPDCRALTVADAATAAELGAKPLSRRTTTATLTELARRVASGELDPHVRSVFSFDQAADALRIVESGHAWGKVVLTV